MASKKKGHAFEYASRSWGKIAVVAHPQRTRHILGVAAASDGRALNI
jgi:hypothetical protein